MTARSDTRPTTQNLMERLAGVKDPCSIGVGSPIDIVSMGLVERIDIDENGATTVHMVLTQPTCWFFADLRQHVVDALVGVEGIAGVRVEVFEELWSPDRMAPGHRRTLARNRPARDERK